MGQMIKRGKELIRIAPGKPEKLEVSTNDGKSWLGRFLGNPTIGQFTDLTDNGTEILATTSKGLHVSKNDGRSWVRR
jgi:hypothetical protein